MPQFKVFFANQDKTLYIKEEQLLAKVCALAGLPLNLPCNGGGRCGKCQVKIQTPKGWVQVLACQTPITADTTILLESADYLHSAQHLTQEQDPEALNFSPLVTKEYLQGDPWLQKFPEFPLPQPAPAGWTLVRWKTQVIDIQPGNTTDLLYGACADIGTTSVVIYIFDLIGGKLLQTYSALNQQITHGADVISRIQYAQASAGNLQEMQQLVIGTLNGLLASASEKLPQLSAHLYHLVLCGNSTMQHLLWGFDPSGLGKSPFSCITQALLQGEAGQLGLSCAPLCQVNFLPLLGGFVGGDTTAVLLTLPEDRKIRLMVDLGTNGEIALGNQSRWLVASTACGPALEGGHIRWGMRSALGAIDRFVISEDQVHFSVIGQGKPLGICGSGILDLIAALLKAGIIDASGHLLSALAYQRRHPDSTLGQRLQNKEDGPCFVITESAPEIYLTQKDIRQIQLAKSAIYAGCLALIDIWGLPLAQVDELVLAGAFGSHIDLDNALYIGLLPPVQRQKVRTIGNGAGRGAQLYLLDQGIRDKSQRIVQHTVHCQLATDSNFTEEYIRQMNFNNAWGTITPTPAEERKTP